MFDGTLLAIELETEMSFKELLKKVHQVNVSIFSQTIPFTELLKLYRYALSKNNPEILNTPLYDTNIIYTAFGLEPREPDNLLGWTINQLETHAGTAPCDFYMELDEKSHVILGRIEYNTKLYSTSYIYDFLALFQRTIKNALSYPDKHFLSPE